MINKRRILSVDLKTARDWYFGDNEALRKLSLEIFSEEELTDISEMFIGYKMTDITVPDIFAPKLKKMSMLNTLAQNFNPLGWVPKSRESKYFIYRDFVDDLLKIKNHETVVYPGIVYFQNKNIAVKVLKILQANPNYNFF